MAFFYYVVSFNQIVHISNREFVVVENNRIIAWVLIFPLTLAGLRARSVIYEQKEIHLGITFSIKHILLFFIFSSFSIFILLHKMFINVLHLDWYIFYPLFSIFGPLFFVIVGILIVGSIMLPFVPNKTKFFHLAQIIKGSTYLTVTATCSLILYYSSQFEEFPLFSAKQPMPVYLNIVADIYILYLFSRLQKLIVLTRRRSSIFSLIIIREYVLFVVRSLVASAFSTYIAFLFSENSLSVVQSARLIVGLNPFGDGMYVGTIFWLVHTAFLPVLTMLTIPLFMIAYRATIIFYSRIIISIVRNGNPIVSVAASLFFMIAFIDLVRKLV